MNGLMIEITKLKRKHLWIIPLITGTILIRQMIFFPRTNKIVEFGNLYLSTYMISFFSLVLVISFLAYIMFRQDYRNGVLKQIFTSSLTPFSYTYPKLLFLYMSACAFNLLQGGIVILTAAFLIPLTAENILMVILMSFLDANLIYLGLTPVFLLIVLLRKQEILALIGILLYPCYLIISSMGITGSTTNSLNYIHPLVSGGMIHNNIISYLIPIGKYGMTALIHIDLKLASISLVFWSIVSIPLIIYFSRGKNL